MISRREALALGLTAGIVPKAGWAGAAIEGRVVVVGGGFGGVNCARWLRRLAPRLAVTLVEPSTLYRSCPFSNLSLVDSEWPMADLTFAYEAVVAEGISVVHQHAVDVDVAGRTLALADGRRLGWDRLVLSPGIDLNGAAVEGFDAETHRHMPHAWRAGEQTQRLGDQLRALPDGGVVLIVAPPNPYRCPPGPYERASLIAHWLQRARPRSKVIILDAKDEFTKGPLFRDAWRELYGASVEWVAGSAGGRVVRVDGRLRTVHTEFDTFRGDVVNLIPPQLAGLLARRAGLDEGLGWCPVDARSFESSVASGVHVIGDAAIAAPMPKSAFAAASQGRLCAAAIAYSLNQTAERPPSLLMNTCYSLIAPDYGISVTAGYRAEDGVLATIAGSAGSSPRGPHPDLRRAEARHAQAWWRNLTQVTFA